MGSWAQRQQFLTCPRAIKCSGFLAVDPDGIMCRLEQPCLPQGASFSRGSGCCQMLLRLQLDFWLPMESSLWHGNLCTYPTTS